MIARASPVGAPPSAASIPRKGSTSPAAAVDAPDHQCWPLFSVATGEGFKEKQWGIQSGKLEEWEKIADAQYTVGTIMPSEANLGRPSYSPLSS